MRNEAIWVIPALDEAEIEIIVSIGEIITRLTFPKIKMGRI